MSVRDVEETQRYLHVYSGGTSLETGVTTRSHTHTDSKGWQSWSLGPTHFVAAKRRTSWGGNRAASGAFCWSVLYPAGVGMRARSCMWLWCVLPQQLNHRARAVKAPVRFPLCAWLHCRREDCRCAAAVNAPPSPRCRASRPVSRARCRRGRWCVFCGLCRGLGANEKIARRTSRCR